MASLSRSRVTPLLRSSLGQTGFLFGIDSLTNLIDYGFHIFLGRVLVPGDFAMVQTVNAILLVVVTTFAVMQPVVARYVAEGAVDESAENRDRAVFQTFFNWSIVLGLGLALLTFVVQKPLGSLLNIPAAAVSLSAVMVLLALLRPVVAGTLQGQQRFIAFGLIRLSYAANRFIIAAVLIGMGAAGLGAVAAMPIGSALALVSGLFFLGRAVWRRAPALPTDLVKSGLRLSTAAFIAYAAYMGLQSSDLIWVNRFFESNIAGSYAAAVLLRRVLALLPGVVTIIMYPRVVTLITQQQLPDRLLAKSLALITGSNLLLSAVYLLFNEPIVRLMFGGQYSSAAALLPGMALAMVGYGIAVVWLNLYLATNPGLFVLLLAATVILQNLLLAIFHQTPQQVVAIFSLSGWALAIGGTVLYFGRLRPALKNQL
ncbi:MAG: oligosaccharide flippase family protein [Candidatus Promineifilaceae bacterium]